MKSSDGAKLYTKIIIEDNYKKVFRLKPKTIIIISIFIAGVLLLGALFYFFIFTKQGAVAITRFGIKNYSKAGKVTIKESQGNIAEGVTYQNLELNNIKFLPAGSVIKIQQLEVSLESFNISGLRVKVENARLFLPDMETILFYGAYENTTLSFKVYSKYVDVRAVLGLVPGFKSAKNVRGSISDLDVVISGGIFAPKLEGGFFIRELEWHKFVMQNCPIILNLSFSDINKDIKINGELLLESGQISGHKTALIKLQKSKILFSQEPTQPRLNIYGSSVVEKTKINIAVRGKLDAPEIQLSSEPSLPKDILIVMLATGKSWKGVSGSLENKSISPELAADLVDYFLFGTAGNKLAKLFGVDNISIRYDGKTKEAEITKGVSSTTDIKYGVEQKDARQNNGQVSQKLGIDQKVTESISLEGEKKINRDATDKNNGNGETNLWLKFKKGF